MMRGILSRKTVHVVMAVAVMSLVMTLSGCGSKGIQSVPLPGGVDTGPNPRTYEVQFSDVLDLVPQSMVKENGVPVGMVESIDVPGNQWYARVKIRVKNSVNLSDQSRVAVQQTSLLGEKFLSLSDPPNSESAPRQNSAVPIPLERTRTATDIEQVLGALSMLLNGGGLNQLQPIVTELNKTLGSRAGTVNSLLKNADVLITQLNRQRDDVINAIDGLAALSSRASAQTNQINRILQELPAGISVLNEQRPQLVDLLKKLDKLGQVGTDVLGKSRASLITDLKALRPILTELSKAAPDLIKTAPLTLTYPLADQIMPAVKGDSTNLFATVDLRLLNQLEALGVGQPAPKYSPPERHYEPVDPKNPYVNGNGPRWGWPTISLLPPGPNWRPGPNTPPSGGTYPINPNPASGSARKPASKPEQFSLKAPPKKGQRFLDGPLGMIGVH